MRHGSIELYGPLIQQTPEGIQVGSGNTASRPAGANNGVIRFNDDLLTLETVVEGIWIDVSGSGANSASNALALAIAYTNAAVNAAIITAENYTNSAITANKLHVLLSNTLISNSVSALNIVGNGITIVDNAGVETITFYNYANGIIGTLPTSQGGTGISAPYFAGEILIGNGTTGTLEASYITPGAGIAVSNRDGGITISATGGTGTVTNVAITSTDFNVTGSPITSSGVFDLELKPSYTSGTYALTTVDNKGRVTSGTVLLPLANGGTGRSITSISNGQLLIGNAISNGFDLATLTAGSNIILTNSNGKVTIATGTGGTVTSVGLTSNSLNIVGNAITSSGTIAVELKNSGVTASTYPLVTVNSQGIVTSGTATLPYNYGGTGHVGPYTAGQILIGNSITGGLDVNTLTAGSGMIITNTNGNVTITSNSAGGSVTNVTVSSRTLTVTGSPITAAGTIDLEIPNSGVTAGTYPLVTVNVIGQVTSASALLGTNYGGTGHTGPYANGQILIGNSTTGQLDVSSLTAGSNIIITNSGGNITIATGTGGTVSNVTITSNTLTVAGGSITNSGVITVDIPNSGVTAGSYKTVTVNNKGIVTAGTNTGLTVKYNNTVTSNAAISLNFIGTGVSVSDDGSGNELIIINSSSGISSNSITIVQTATGTTNSAQLSVAPTIGNYVLLIYVGIPSTPPNFSLLTSYQILSGTNYYNAYGRLIQVGDGNPIFSTAGAGANVWKIFEINGGTPLGATSGLPSPTTGSVVYTTSSITAANGLVIWSAFNTNNNNSAIIPANTTYTTGAFSSFTTYFFTTPVANTGTVTLGYTTSGTNDGMLQVPFIPSVVSYLTSVGIASNTLVVAGSPITGSGTININLANNGITPGIYSQVYVSNTGIITSANAINTYQYGGTGHSGPYTSGQLLIGNTVSGGLDVNNLTAGTGIQVTNQTGGITISVTGAVAGALTQFYVTSNTLTVAGSPVASSNATVSIDLGAQPFGFAIDKTLSNYSVSTPIAYMQAPVNWTINANMAGSSFTLAAGGTQPVANTAFNLQLAGSTIGTITFAANTSVATLVLTGNGYVITGNVVSIVAPSNYNNMTGRLYGVLAGTR